MNLHGYSFPQLVRLLKFLRGGSIGFDAHRDERTRTKDRIVDFIRSAFDDEAIRNGIKAATLLTQDEYKGAKQAGYKIESLAAEDFAADGAQGVQAHAQGNGVADAAQQLARALAAMQPQAQPMDEGKVRSIAGEVCDERWISVQTAVQQAIDNMPARALVIQQAGLPEVKFEGRQHFRFESLVKLCNTRKRDGTRFNIWLHGPAGAGKTTAGIRVAKALNLAFHLQSAVVEPFQLLGYKDAQSNVVRTPFREAWENGGIVLMSEADSNSEAAMLAINPALANGICTFPDVQLPRHKDCIVIADANTNGSGGTLAFNGRTKQDSAYLSRFAFFDWPIDEAVERDASGNVEWCRLVQKVRKIAKEQGADLTITPRATFDGADLLAQGWKQSDVVQLVVRQGASDEAWRVIESKVSSLELAGC